MSTDTNNTPNTSIPAVIPTVSMSRELGAHLKAGETIEFGYDRFRKQAHGQGLDDAGVEGLHVSLPERRSSSEPEQAVRYGRELSSGPVVEVGFNSASRLHDHRRSTKELNKSLAIAVQHQADVANGQTGQWDRQLGVISKQEAEEAEAAWRPISRRVLLGSLAVIGAVAITPEIAIAGAPFGISALVKTRQYRNAYTRKTDAMKRAEKAGKQYKDSQILTIQKRSAG